jgi:uncharacterized protein (TIGR03437 family)
MFRGKAGRAALVAALVLGALTAGQRSVRTTPPAYSESSIVNSIQPAAPLSINSYVSIYGTDLSWNTVTVSEQHLRAGFLPTELGGVRVLLDSHPAHLLYVSPGQVNFVVPNTLLPKTVRLWILRDGVQGPEVRIALLDTSPVLFSLDPETVLATNADYSVVTRDNPAKPGAHIVLYAAGLGQTSPAQSAGKLADRAAEITRRPDLRVLCEGEALPEIGYAGVTPGFAGLYQINVRLPDNLSGPARLRLVLGERSSAELGLPVAAETQLSFFPPRLYH